MEDRGARPSIVCPRCGQSAPPQQTRLVTCASCGLSFDATKIVEPHTKLAPQRPRGIQGEFRAPSMGFRAAPFPITGPGTCELGDQYLTVSGFRTRGALLRFAVVMAGLAVGIAIGMGLSAMYMADKIVVGVPMVVFIATALMPLPPSKLEARFRIPYENIHKVVPFKMRYASSNTVLIIVRDFAPKGEIHFLTEDPETFIAALGSRVKESR